MTIDSFQEYRVDLGELHNWLPWGGLVAPQIVRNKDNSLMGFIRYQKSAKRILLAKENGRNLGKGWAMWSELRHFQGRDERTLTLCWNPFCERKNGRILNAPGRASCRLQEAESVFLAALQSFCQGLQLQTAKILQNEEVLQYLAETLTGEPSAIAMYTPPLYLDAVLSRDVKFQVFGKATKKKNDLSIGGREITIVTPLGHPESSVLAKLFEAFSAYDYRFAKRFLFWDADGAEKELNQYMRSWCKGRGKLKSFMRQQTLRGFNGVYTDTFVFRFAPEEREKEEAHLAETFRAFGLPHIFEDYNRKHVWWGTLPGCFRANIVTPLGGIDAFSELLLEEEHDVQAESL